MEKKVEEKGDTPVGSIFCLKTRQDMKKIEEQEDCFILDFNPFDSFDVQRLPCSSDEDLAIIHENAKVACGDYPHPRHLCLNFAFGSTPNETYCDMCYCYICEKSAPCAKWTSSHCNASADSAVQKKSHEHVRRMLQILRERSRMMTISLRKEMEKLITTIPSLREEETPVRDIFCLKTRQDMKRIEETEDCFILDFNPFDSFDMEKLTLSDDKDIAIIHETGQVACRDYPHPRHLCLNFPFGSTPNETYCDLCYCSVCDKPAPCAKWTSSHCNASET